PGERDSLALHDALPMLMQQNILVVLLLLFGSSLVPSVYYFLMGRKAKSGTLALTASSLNAALSVLLLISFWGAPELTIQGTWFTDRKSTRLNSSHVSIS